MLDRSCWKFSQNIFHRGQLLSQKNRRKSIVSRPMGFLSEFCFASEAGLFGAPVRSKDTEMFEVTVIPEMCCELD